MVAVSLKKDFFQAEDGIRDFVGSRGLGDVYKRQVLEGYGDLRNNENIGTDQKDTLKVNYRNGDWGASLSALRVGELLDNGVKSDDGQVYVIPSMTTANVSVYKKFELNGNDARLRFMIRNVADERAPLADGWFGFYSDIHRDEGRHYYVDLRMDF